MFILIICISHFPKKWHHNLQITFKKKKNTHTHTHPCTVFFSFTVWLLLNSRLKESIRITICSPFWHTINNHCVLVEKCKLCEGFWEKLQLPGNVNINPPSVWEKTFISTALLFWNRPWELGSELKCWATSFARLFLNSNISWIFVY